MLSSEAFENKSVLVSGVYVGVGVCICAFVCLHTCVCVNMYCFTLLVCKKLAAEGETYLVWDLLKQMSLSLRN